MDSCQHHAVKKKQCLVRGLCLQGHWAFSGILSPQIAHHGMENQRAVSCERFTWNRTKSTKTSFFVDFIEVSDIMYILTGAPAVSFRWQLRLWVLCAREPVGSCARVPVRLEFPCAMVS